MSYSRAPPTGAGAEPSERADAMSRHLALPPRAGASPGLLRRRYSVPETIMRKYRLAQQRSDSEETGAVTSPPASASPPRGSCNSLCESPQRFLRRDREVMRKSALLRRLWGRAGACGADCCGAACGRETRSLDGSRAELRPLSGSLASSRHSQAPGWASPKRQRLDFPRDLRSSDEMLRAAMRNSYDRAEESRYERAAKGECSDSSCPYRGREASSFVETTTDAMTDSDTSKFDVNSDSNAYTQYSERLSSDAVTAEVRSEEHHTDDVPSENSPSNTQMDDNSYADSSDTLSTSMSTAKETNGFVVGSKISKQMSKSAHIDGRISERSASVENDENNVLPYDTPLTVETPSYELLEIVVSETLNSNNVPALKTTVPESTSNQTLKAPVNHRFPQNINIDEYVSNILVESLNSLTDQLECMNASIGSDRKINIVEKEIKVKLQNTGVNTIVHLSPTSNNQIIFGNEELCNNDGRKDSCNNPQDARDSVTIRDEMLSVESNNNQSRAASPAAFYAAPHDHVNQAVLQQIQKLFQDELQSMSADVNYQVASIPGVSHIEISNVDVYLDDNSDPTLDRNETIEMHTQHNVEISEIISGVGTGNYYEDVDNNVVVPRFSAFPHTDSMEVNTSSSDDAELVGSDCTSLVDSLDDPNSPRSILLRRSFNNNSNKRSELVRSAIDVLDLLPETSPKEDETSPKERGEAFFIRIKDNDCDCEKENVIVADHMPEKIKQRLYRRHRKRELRMECARRSKVKQLKRELERQRHSSACARQQRERECAALVAALVDELIAKVAQDEYKCMRIKQKPPKMLISKSDENISRKTWRKDVDFCHGKESHRTSRGGAPIVYMDKPDRSKKKSDRHHIHGKLSLLTHPSSLSPDDSGPKRIYQKSEIHDGNKCIEILEILEYVNGSQSSPETTNSDENHNHKSKKSRIPVPVYERIQKTPKGNSQKGHHASGERLVSSPTAPPRDRSKKSNNLLANMLREVLAGEDSPEPAHEPARRASVPLAEPRSRSNSLRFRRVFDSIPEEKSSVSFESSTEDACHNRRASAPTLVETLTARHNSNGGGAKPTEPTGENEPTKSINFTRGVKETKSAGTSPIVDEEAERREQRLKSQTTMTSPSHKSAATSPMRSSSGAPTGAAGAAGAAAASGKRGLASRSRAWLGFTRPETKLEEGIALACASPLVSHRTASVSVE
ncbi:uncharacterized protein LOC135081696 [Ostrinia nubilalis]|uniref:uncharacterized protein LOC135081696 n=1 Tax=Ostrinia nubilalis TaxID=29057 RepID=UPI003082551B